MSTSPVRTILAFCLWSPGVSGGTAVAEHDVDDSVNTIHPQPLYSNAPQCFHSTLSRRSPSLNGRHNTTTSSLVHSTQPCIYWARSHFLIGPTTFAALQSADPLASLSIMLVNIAADINTERESAGSSSHACGSPAHCCPCPQGLECSRPCL